MGVTIPKAENAGFGQAQTQPSQTPFQRDHSTGANFGAAQAQGMRALGGGIGQLGNAVTGIALDMRNRRNVADVDNTVNGFISEMQRTTMDLTTRRGQSALGMTDEFFATTAPKLKEVWSSKLKNQRQKELFEHEVLKRMPGFEASVIGHEHKETRAYADDQNLAGQALAIDIGDYAMGLEHVEASAQDDSPEEHDRKVLAFNTTWHQRQISDLMVSDPRAALAYIDEHKDEIADTQEVKLRAAIQEVTRLDDAQRAADGYMMRGLSEPATYAAIHKELSGEQEQATLSLIRQRFAEKEAGETAQRDAVTTGIMRELAAGRTTMRDIIQTNPDVVAIVGDKLGSLLAFEKHLKPGAGPVVQNHIEYQKFLNMTDAARSKVQLVDYVGILDTSHLSKMETMIESAKNAMGSDSGGSASSGSGTASANKKVNAVGDAVAARINDFTKRMGGKDLKLQSNYTRAYELQIEQRYAMNGGVPLTTADMHSIEDDLSVEIETDPGLLGFWASREPLGALDSGAMVLPNATATEVTAVMYAENPDMDITPELIYSRFTDELNRQPQFQAVGLHAERMSEQDMQVVVGLLHSRQLPPTMANIANMLSALLQTEQMTHLLTENATPDADVPTTAPHAVAPHVEPQGPGWRESLRARTTQGLTTLKDSLGNARAASADLMDLDKTLSKGRQAEIERIAKRDGKKKLIDIRGLTGKGKDAIIALPLDEIRVELEKEGWTLNEDGTLKEMR